MKNDEKNQKVVTDDIVATTDTPAVARSIRAKTEVFEQLKAIAEESFDSQGQALESLIQLWEINQSKAILLDRKVEIENFQLYINKIQSAFTMSLELNADAEDRIRSEFSRMLISKDDTIVLLNDKIKNIEQLIKTNNVAAEAATAELALQLEVVANQAKEIDTMRSSLDDKSRLVEAHRDQLTDYKNQIEKLTAELLDKEQLANEVIDLKNKVKELTESLSRQKEQALRSAELTELAKERALIASERASEERIKIINDEHNQAIKEYMKEVRVSQKAYQTLQTKHESDMQSLRDEYKASIDAYKAQVAKLK